MQIRIKQHRLLQPIFYFLPVLLIGILGCSKHSNDEIILMDLFRKEKKLNCTLVSMKDSISTEWDNINNLLETSLPQEMPQEERMNMLKVRNANLIRMFQSFDGLDEAVKVALMKTEEMDKEMTKRITSLKKEANEIESQKRALFEKISQSVGAEEVARIKDANEVLLSLDCE